MTWIGEETVQCDPLVREAMTTFCSNYKGQGCSDGHFVRRSENIKPYVISEAVYTLVKMPVKLHFMIEK